MKSTQWCFYFEKIISYVNGKMWKNEMHEMLGNMKMSMI